MKNSLIRLIINGDFKNNTWLFFKGILILIPILSIVGMFSTVQIISSVNQKNFLNNSTFDWIHYSDNKIMNENSFGFLETQVGQLISTDGGVFYKHTYPVELYFIEEGKENSPYKLEGTYFNEKNFLNGSIDTLTSKDASLAVALTYNTAKGLKVKTGDTAVLLFMKGDDIPVYYPITVMSILKPKYNNEFGRAGLALAIENAEFSDFLNDNNIVHGTAMFGTNNDDFIPTENVIYKKELAAKTSINILSDKNIINTVFAAMGIVVVFLIINREVNFYVNRRFRSIGILSALGTTKKILLNIIFIEHFVKIVLSSLIAGIIMKFIIFQKVIGEYIDILSLMMIVLFFIIVGLISLIFSITRVKKVLSDTSIAIIISKKPEEL